MHLLTCMYVHKQMFVQGSQATGRRGDVDMLAGSGTDCTVPHASHYSWSFCSALYYMQVITAGLSALHWTTCKSSQLVFLLCTVLHASHYSWSFCSALYYMQVITAGLSALSAVSHTALSMSVPHQ